MPWQQHVVDIAMEYDPVTKHLAYNEVRLTVPRQSGKSSLVLPTVVFRAEGSKYFGGPQTMLYAAQTGSDARRMWREDFVEKGLKLCSTMDGRFRVNLPSGHESVVFKDGSRFSPIALTEKSGHGRTLDVGFLDEAFAQVDNRVDQAWGPALSTRTAFGQKWIVSTVGTAKSVYLREKVDQGRMAAEAGLTEGICYIEWSADPQADPSDPATWWSCMPALGVTQTELGIRALYNSMPEPEFRRAFLNQWTDLTQESKIPTKSWDNCRDVESKRIGHPILGVDIAFERDFASIAVAGVRSDGLPHVQVIQHGPGTDWLVTAIVAAVKQGGVQAVAVDGGGPAGSIIVDLMNAGVPLKVMTTQDMKNACGALRDAVVSEQVRHIGQNVVDLAISGADTRVVQDAWAWKRRSSVCDISPLVAITNALWGLSNTPDTDYDVLDSVL